jgi:hypothetical protein
MRKTRYAILLICYAGLCTLACHARVDKGQADDDRGLLVCADTVTQFGARYPEFAVAERTYDFGEVRQGDVVRHRFRFKNTGSKPLVIHQAASTCGCTVPTFPKEAIPPGGEGDLQVVFHSAGKSGKQVKPIFIQANTMPDHFQLQITCQVVAVP